MTIGDYNPYPVERQTRRKADIPTKAEKKSAEAKRRDEGIAAATDSKGRIICYLCKKPILPTQRMHSDHVIPRSRGKKATIQRPTHEDCHMGSHQTGDGQRLRKDRLAEITKGGGDASPPPADPIGSSR